MSCAACSARVESAVSKVEGVTECSVNLLTNLMTVEGEVDSEVIISAVKSAGYDAKIKSGERVKNEEMQALVRRLILSLGFLVALMYLSMGVVMWNAPFFPLDAFVIAYCEMILSLIVIIINRKFFTSGVKSLLKGAPNMDTLVALGSVASFVYSTVLTVIMTIDRANLHFLHDLYFESSAMILALITVGKTLEAYAKGKTTSALEALINLAPKTATVLRDGKEVTIPATNLRVGDLFVVRAGGITPCDGIIVEGHGTMDESALTGESVPVDKAEGDEVYSATVNGFGYIVAKATRVGEDSTLGEIIKMVEGANSTKAPIAKLADKVSGIFVPIVMCIAIITTTVWLILGEAFGRALSYGISVLVISCPCALGLATPVAIMVGSGVGAKKGILFKSASAIETAGRIRIVALDKTGTVTEGKPSVSDIIPYCEEESELLSLAYALEKRSEHPLGKAISEYCKPYESFDVTKFEVIPGKGVRGEQEGETAFAGNLNFIKTLVKVSQDIENKCNALAEQGKTPMLFVKKDKVVGVIAIKDAIKKDSKRAVERLKKAGVRVVMLTGDNERTATAVAKEVGIEEVRASLLPQDKERVIRELMKEGKTAMVGDGINDAVALTVADLGIAIGAGADVALSAAEVVLVSGSLGGVVTSLNLGKKTLKNVKENLFWAFFYNCLTIPVASGVFSSLGVNISPMLSAAAMSLSSFCVVLNALRLNLFKEKNEYGSEKSLQTEVKNMTITLKIEGMMCPHCEKRVKDTLESIEGVKKATVSHEEGNAVIEGEVERELLVGAIEAQGYKVKE